MRVIGFLTLFTLLISGCDPYQLVYIRNYSAKPVVVEAYLTKRYNFPRPEKVNSKDSIFENKKDLYEISFNSLSIKTINDSTYQAVLPGNSTNMLEPVCMGFPIRKVILRTKEVQDSVVFSGREHNLKKAKKKKLLQKLSMSTFVIDFGRY